MSIFEKQFHSFQIFGIVNLVNTLTQHHIVYPNLLRDYEHVHMHLVEDNNLQSTLLSLAY